jgi:hypothetical protein
MCAETSCFHQLPMRSNIESAAALDRAPQACMDGTLRREIVFAPLPPLEFFKKDFIALHAALFGETAPDCAAGVSRCQTCRNGGPDRRRAERQAGVRHLAGHSWATAKTAYVGRCPKNGECGGPCLLSSATYQLQLCCKLVGHRTASLCQPPSQLCPALI